MLDHTPGLSIPTFTAQEILIGRALGRALAHELGHDFLRSKIHSSAGLMRSARPSNEFFGLMRDGFQLDAGAAGHRSQPAAWHMDVVGFRRRVVTLFRRPAARGDILLLPVDGERTASERLRAQRDSNDMPARETVPQCLCG